MFWLFTGAKNSKPKRPLASLNDSTVQEFRENDMRSRIWMLLLALGPAPAFAWGDDCKFRADRAGGVDAKGVEKVVCARAPAT